MSDAVPTITFADFAKVEIRIGEVKTAEVPEGSKHLIKLVVDFGEEIGERVIFTGILAWYGPEDLQGKQFPFVLNLPPKRMGTLGESAGMIMAASPKEADGSESAVLLAVTAEVPNGTIVR